MLVLVTSTKLVVDTAVVSQVAVAMVTMMQELQRSVLDSVVPVLVADIVAVVAEEAGADMLVALNEVVVVDMVVVADVADVFLRNNRATNNICLHHPRQMVK